MTSKALKKPYIEFVGQSGNDVTGSSYLVKYNEYQILVDYGLYQSNNLIDDYKTNKTRHKSLKPKQLDFVFATQAHIDHIGKLPELYKNGCTAPLYTPKDTIKLMKLMLMDSAKIMATECEQLNTKHGIKATPLYDNDDIMTMFEYVVEYNIGETIVINDTIKFTTYNARHIPKAVQILLELNNSINGKKILFTGDIGSPTAPCHYLADFDCVEQCDVVIGEATYSDNRRKHSIKDRPKDVDKLHTVISQAIEKKAKVLIPVFSLSRLQMVLTLLYEMYGSNLSIPVIIDTPLGTKISSMWGDLIDKDDELWYKVHSWQNIKIAHEYGDSKYWQELDEPMIILSSGGMLSAGRAVGWAKKIVNNSKHHICFCGFAGQNTLAHQIKNHKEYPYVNVDGVKLKNKCNVTILNSFSSHMCYEELMEYYCSINYLQLVLVHSEDKSKIKFAEDLRERLSKANKTSKVVCGQKDMKVYF